MSSRCKDDEKINNIIRKVKSAFPEDVIKELSNETELNQLRSTKSVEVDPDTYSKYVIDDDDDDL